jgi:hypothetical protein
MAQLIVRGTGVTPSERYLKQLCDLTFLSLWSHPAIYRDQRIAERSEGKELADLLVVFDSSPARGCRCCSIRHQVRTADVS